MTNPFTRWDLAPLRELGIRQPRRHVREWSEGVSVFDDRDALIEVMRDTAFQRGRFIATLVIPDESDVEIRKTFRNPHHYTIYARPEMLSSFVTGPLHEVDDDLAGSDQ
jgi:hypothetical protein